MDGSFAIITGAASGLGLAHARLCRARNFRLFLIDQDEVQLEQVSAELGRNQVDCAPMDVSDARGIAALADRVRPLLGEVNYLMNFAGVAGGARAWETSPLDWDWVTSVNLSGVVHTCRTFVGEFLATKKPGHVVNCSSIVAFLDFYTSAPYQLSKQAVLTFSLNLRQALKKSPIRVTCLCPDSVATRILESPRHRPSPMQPGSAEERLWSRHVRLLQSEIQKGRSPDFWAERTFEGLQRDWPLVFADAEQGQTLLGALATSLSELSQQIS
jgi:NADP-dependent 3-hydroxy acid dehydrogenase YdfG